MEMEIPFSIGGDLPFVEKIIRRIVPMHTLSPNGETALVIAAKEGCISMIKTLMPMYCAESNCSLNNGYVLFWAIGAAIARRQTAVLIHLIKNESQLNYDHLLVMQTCYRQCNLELLKLLLKSGVDVNATSTLQPSSLLLFATDREYFDPEKYKLLVRHTTDVIVSAEGFTVFHKAIMTDRLGVSSWDNMVNCAIKQQSSNMIKMLMGYVNEEALGTWMSCNRKIYDKYKQPQSEKVPRKKRRMYSSYSDDDVFEEN
ncbi:hypothetical protein CHUAL_006301 [Chamberlinius hualienensis]